MSEEISKRDRAYNEVLLVLRELGGEVRDSDGFAVRRIYERMATEVPYGLVSGLISDLEADGEIVRDMPSLKRTTRVALNRKGVSPPVKDIKVVLEQFSRTMVDDLEGAVNRIIDAHVGAAIEAERDGLSAAMNTELEAKVGQLQGTVTDLRERLTAAKAEPAALRARVDQVEEENADLRERLRIAEHNVEVWRQNAMGRPQFHETMAALKDRLPEHQKRQLEAMMRELPSG